MAQAAGVRPIMSVPGWQPEDDQSARITAASVTLMAMSLVIVGLRFVARKLSKAGLWWDDWMILAAMIISWGPCISMLIAVSDGFGKHMDVEGTLPERITKAQNWFKNLYAFSTLYTFAITLAKYSILLFYSRIFKEKKFLIALKVVFVIVTLWFIAIQAAVFAECVPVNALWNPAVSGACIDFAKFYQGSGIPNVALNTAILLLPLPMIWSLEIEKRHKFALSGVFLLGSFVVIVSIIRLVFIARLEYPPIDITWTFVDPGIWTAVEPNVAVMSASLPILRSLWIWNRRKRTQERGTGASSNNGEVKVAPYRSHAARQPPPSKEIRDSVASGQYAMNDLPAGAQHANWGNHVAVYAASNKTSSEDYHNLPIMHPSAGPLTPDGHGGPQRPQRPHMRPQISELYGS